MGQFRSVPCLKKQSQQGSSSRFSYAVTGMCGWRITMEDAHIAHLDIDKNCSLFAVFDGHGGSQVAKYAAKHFIPTLLNNQHYKNKNYEKSLIDTYVALDNLMKTPEGVIQLKNIKKQSLQKPKTEEQQQEPYAGCTAVVCLVTQDYIYVANAGDSRCMVCAKELCEPLSFDHKPDDEAELIRIKNAGGDVIQGRVNGNINLSRALGDFQYKQNKQKAWDQQLIICKPDIMRRTLQDVEYIILGCDGIFQKKSNEEITEMVRTKAQDKTLKQVGQQIVDSLIAPSSQHQKGLDNMSIIIVKVKQI